MSTKFSSARNSVLRVALRVCVVSWASWASFAIGASAAESTGELDAPPQRGQIGQTLFLLRDNARELWRGYKQDAWPEGWAVEEGVLSRTTGGDDIMTKEQYRDFELRLQWKISPGGNSGIMYRVSTGEKAAYLTGPEYQILDDAKHKDGKKTATSAASLYALYARGDDVLRPAGQWNDAQIVVVGNHVEHWLNGRKVVDCEIGSDDWNRRLKESKFAEWPKFAKNTQGHIVLQDHGDPVSFRKIEIRQIAR